MFYLLKQVRYITLLIRTTIIFKEVTSIYSILILYHAYKLSEVVYRPNGDNLQNV